MRLLNPLFALLGASTDAQLARSVEFLKAENRILRDKLPKRLTVTKQERNRLVKLGKGLGSAIKDLITIVSPRTFARWMAGDKKPVSAKKEERKPGRPRTAEDIRELVLRLANESGWGYTRILGELKKLGIGTVSRSTVVNILKDAGLDPGPKRGVGTWDDFITRHTATLWAADFLSVKTWTMNGVVDLYLLFLIHIGTRKVIISNPTASPDAKWVAQQARNATMTMDDWGLPASYLIIDHDSKFAKHFDEVFAADGTKVIRVGPLAPNMNAYAERFVQTLRVECLDHFVVCGEKHLRHLVKEFVTHYHEERPHQGRGNMPLSAGGADEPQFLPFTTGEVVCRERLGGLLRHYSRVAA
jgi:putative transposase